MFAARKKIRTEMKLFDFISEYPDENSCKLSSKP